MLYTTVRHLFYDQCRRNKIIVFESIEGRDSPLDPPDPSMAPDRAGSADLDTLLAGLRAEEREALYLNAVEGYTAREIAERTGSPRNSILSLIHRAKHKLARAIGLPNGDTNATDHESEANGNE